MQGLQAIFVRIYHELWTNRFRIVALSINVVLLINLMGNIWWTNISFLQMKDNVFRVIFLVDQIIFFFLIEKMCRECFRRLASCRCDKCDVIMCQGCFEKVLKVIKLWNDISRWSMESKKMFELSICNTCKLCLFLIYTFLPFSRQILYDFNSVF